MRRETTAGTEWDSSYFAYAADNSMTKRLAFTPPSTSISTYFYYDPNGALVRQWDYGTADATYFWYGPHKLVTALRPVGGPISYFAYDAQLNRYAIDNGGTVTYYLWNGLKLLEERDAGGSLVARYTHGYSRNPEIGSISEVERHVGATTYYQYLHMDHRGTTYAVTDQAGAVQLQYTQDAFGRQLAPVGGTNPAVPNDNIWQTNWKTIPFGGKNYLVSKYRIADEETGIFLSRDFLPYPNLYRAFSNNPIMKIDSDGRGDADTDQNKKRGFWDGVLAGTVETSDPFTHEAAIENAVLANVTDPRTNDTYRAWVVNYQGEWYPLDPQTGLWRERIDRSDFEPVTQEAFVKEQVEEFLDGLEITDVKGPEGETSVLENFAKTIGITAREYIEDLIPDVARKIVNEVNRPLPNSAKPLDIANELKRRNVVVPQIAEQLTKAIGDRLEDVATNEMGISNITAKLAVAAALVEIAKKGYSVIGEEITIDVSVVQGGVIRVRADIVATKYINGKLQLFVFEIKGNSGRLTKNQKPGYTQMPKGISSTRGKNAENAGLAPKGGAGSLRVRRVLLIRVQNVGKPGMTVKVERSFK